MKTSNIYQSITNQIIELLESPNLPYTKSWVNIGEDGLPARNLETQKQYSGINQLILSFSSLKKSYPKNAWLTFLQVKQLGGKVKKGEKSTKVVYYQTLFFDKDKNRISEAKVKTLTVEQQAKLGITEIPMLKTHNVFNVFQTEGLPESYYQFKQKEMPTPFVVSNHAQDAVKKSGVLVTYKQGNRAFYDPIKDEITLPETKQFLGEVEHMETLLHEIGHSTGHPSRLNRNLFNKFGTKDYAREELVAELFAAFACAKYGYTKSITNNAAYVQSWLKALKEDPKAIFTAAAKAQKAVEFLGLP